LGKNKRIKEEDVPALKGEEEKFANCNTLFKRERRRCPRP
jgi:hypothetical protein